MKKTIKWADSEKSKHFISTTRTKAGVDISQTTYSRDQWRKETRKKLLLNATTAEKIVFQGLPPKIKDCAIQQWSVVINGYMFFIDIYVKKLNIAIEVDGGYHTDETQQISDTFRDKLLASKGIRVYRISNDVARNADLLNDFYSVLKLVKPRGKFKGFSKDDLRYVSNANEVVMYMPSKHNI